MQHQVRVRLTARVSGNSNEVASVNVRLSNEEREKIQAMATDNGYSAKRGLSTFMRDACVVAASDLQTNPPTRGPGELLYLAADSCGLALGAWMRLVLLASTSGLERQCFCLRVALECGDLKRETEEL